MSVRNSGLSLKGTPYALLPSRHAAVTAETAVKAGSVIGTCMPRHRAQEFRKFLDEVERNVPAGLDVHVVMDNASSHKTKLIRNWFAKRPHWRTHFTPTSSSWINQVERFFALLAGKQIKRGTHTSVKELIAAIEAFISQHNANPKPLRWTKSADDILATISASAAAPSTSTLKLDRNFRSWDTSRANRLRSVQLNNQRNRRKDWV